MNKKPPPKMFGEVQVANLERAIAFSEASLRRMQDDLDAFLARESVDTERLTASIVERRAEIDAKQYAICRMKLMLQNQFVG